MASEVKVAQSCPTRWDPMDYIYSPWNSPGQNTGAGSRSLLQGIFLTQGLNPGLLLKYFGALTTHQAPCLFLSVKSGITVIY